MQKLSIHIRPWRCEDLQLLRQAQAGLSARSLWQRFGLGNLAGHRLVDAMARRYHRKVLRRELHEGMVRYTFDSHGQAAAVVGSQAQNIATHIHCLD